MPIYLGDQNISDVFKGEPVCSVYVGDVLMFGNGCKQPSAPGVITTLSASDNEFESVIIDFSEASGYPDPVYDLYEDTILIQSDITPPYVHAVIPGTRDYYVTATNSEGTTQSNTDAGTSMEPSAPGEITDLEATDDEYNQITVTWTNSIGHPHPIHDIYQDDILIESGVSSPYVISILPGTYTYYVEANNGYGTVISNSDDGTSSSGIAPGEITDFNATDGEGHVDVSFSNATGEPAPTYDLYQDDSMVESGITSPHSHSVGNGTRDYYVKAINPSGEADSNENSAMSGDSPGSFTMSMTSPSCAWWEVTWNSAGGYPTPDYYWYTTAYPNDGVDLNEGDSPHVHGCMQGFSGTCIMEASNQFGTSESNHLSVYCYPCAEAEAREKISYLVASGKLDIMSKNKKDT